MFRPFLAYQLTTMLGEFDVSVARWRWLISDFEIRQQAKANDLYIALLSRSGHRG
jgi:hypothetical protein